MTRAGKCFAVSGVLSRWLATASSAADAAADAANDTYTFYGVAEPQGPATASYLRMHHPLYLLDRFPQVKAGTLRPPKPQAPSPPPTPHPPPPPHPSPPSPRPPH